MKTYPKINTAILTLTGLVLLFNDFALADNMYVSCMTDRKIYKVDSSGNKIVFANVEGACDLILDKNGSLYVSFLSSIMKFDSSGQGSVFASGFQDIMGLGIDASDNLYATSYNGGKILKFNSSGSWTTFAEGLNEPFDIAFDNSGNLYASSFIDGTIMKYDPAGNATTFASGLNYPRGLAFDQIGNLYAGIYLDNTIMKFDSAGNGSAFSTDLDRPFSLAFDSSGCLYASDIHGIFKLDSTGNATYFCSCMSPTYITFEPVPEPASVILIGAGLVFCRIRRRHN